MNRVRSKKGWIAVAQMTATKNIETNFAQCSSLVAQAKSHNCDLVCLPEAFDFVGESSQDSLDMAETLDGPLMTRYRDLAKQNEIWVSLGGFHEKIPDSQTHVYNTHVILNNKGDIQALYRKIHLFDVDLSPAGPVLQESKSTRAGDSLTSVESPCGTLGLTICYDLRFPEIFASYRMNTNAEILLVPSAFTASTGKAHWEPLLRARAIETQCYVVAAAQIGKHNAKRESHGNAMIIDPWGKIVACCSDKVGIAMAEIDMEYLDSVRKSIPVYSHRRPDLFGGFQFPHVKEEDSLTNVKKI